MKKTILIGAFVLLALSMHATARASDYPDGCRAGDNFSSTTGHPCAAPKTCQPGDLYDAQTGQPCGSGAYFPGCASLFGYSATTGIRCDGALRQVVGSLAPIAQSGSISVASNPDRSYDPGLSVGTNQDVGMGFFSVTNTGTVPVTISAVHVGMSGGDSGVLVYRVYNPPTLVAAGAVLSGGGDDSEDIPGVTISPGLSADFQVKVSGTLGRTAAGATILATVSFFGDGNASGSASVSASVTG